MKVLLILLALGGYSGSSPALLKIEVASIDECNAVAHKLISDLSVRRGLGSPYRAGAENFNYSCIEVSK